MIQPFVDGVILGDACRVDEAVDVLVPRLQPHLLGTDGHIVANLLVQVAEVLLEPVLLPILCHAGHDVLAHLEVGLKECLCLHHEQRVLGNALQGSELVLFNVFLQLLDAVDGLEGLANQQLVLAEHGVLKRQLLGDALRNAFLQTACRQLHKQFGQPLLAGQIEIVPQYIFYNKEEVQLPGVGDVAARQQSTGRVARLLLNNGGCHAVVGIDGNGVLVPVQVGVGAEVNGIFRRHSGDGVCPAMVTPSWAA